MSEIDWSEAPEGATHAAFGDGMVAGWYRKEAGTWVFWPAKGWGFQKWGADCSQDPHTDRPGLIPRPAWRGPEDGLPPVGTVCEAKRRGGWDEVEVVAHVRSLANQAEVIVQANEDWDWMAWPEAFRPLKSDKERALDAAAAVHGDRWTPDFIQDVFGPVYDAGLLRLPEEQS